MGASESAGDAGSSAPGSIRRIRWLVLGVTVVIGGIVGVLSVRFFAPRDSNDAGAMHASAVAYVPPSREGYVGSRACAPCHEEICQAYAEHPMFLSTRPLEELELVESFDPEVTSVSAWGRRYRVVRSGEHWTHSEALEDGDGQTLYQQTEEVAFGVGAGLKGRSYLIWRDGWLYQSPLTWYSEKGQWGLSPGYDHPANSRFDRMVNDSCLFCHTANPLYTSRTNRRLQEPPFAEVGIGCERCHGPGQEHIELMEKAEREGIDVDDYRIVQPDSLPPAQRDSVCFQCHLEGKARILRKGRELFDFRPGQDLEEVWTVFVGEDEEALFTGQPEQMRSSVCYRRSEGRMGCTSCHDPHRKPLAQERVSFYRERCLACHQEQGCSEAADVREAQDNSCIACHMPRLPTEDVAHATVSDHRILRRPEPASSHRRVERGTWRRFSDYRLPPREARRARVLADYQRAAASSDWTLGRRVQRELEELARVDSSDFAVCSALANLYALQEDYPQAKKWAEAALKQKPEHCQTLALLGLICYRLDADDESLRYYGKLMEVNPYYVLGMGPYADLLRLHGRREKAVEVARRGVALDPLDIRLRAVLVDCLLAVGQIEEAQKQRDLLTRIRQELQRRNP